MDTGPGPPHPTVGYFQGTWKEILLVIGALGVAVISATWAINTGTEADVSERFNEHNKSVHVGALTVEQYRLIEAEKDQRLTDRYTLYMAQIHDLQATMRSLLERRCPPVDVPDQGS